jgi:HEAT repeat protein
MQALGAMRYDRAASALADQFRYFKKGDVAEAAIAALARIGNASSSSLFVAQLSSSSPVVKTAAIEGLARIGDATPREAIERTLGGNLNERVVLAGTFASIRFTGSPIDQLIEALRKPQLAAQARQYLIELAPGRAALFSRHAQDPDVQIRSGVADVLGIAGDATALAIVEPMQRDQDQQVAIAAERAVARLRP